MNRNLYKIVLIAITVLLAASVCVLASCSLFHKHSYTDWISDDDNHWREANCGHYDVIDYGPHYFHNGFCIICDYPDPDPDKDPNGNYTVTFVADQLVIFTAYYSAQDKNIIEPEVPEKTGYTGKWEDYTLTKGNVTVNAIYTPIKYSVTFKADGVTVDTQYYTVEDRNITEPQLPEKEGYTGRWGYYSLTYGDITVNANYTAIQYSVTFKADGKEVAKRYFTIEDQNITAPQVPAKTGYTGQWEGYTLQLKSITVNAVYTAKTYTVLLDYNGATGNIGPSQITVTYDQPIGELPLPTLTDIRFIGWYYGEELISDTSIWVYDEDCATIVVKWKQFTDGLEYTDIDEYTVAVSGLGSVTDSDIAIPNMHNGKKVVAVAPYFYTSKISILTIPSSITRFEDHAFAGTMLSRVYYTGSIEQWCNIEFGYASNPLSNSYLYIDNKLVTDLIIPESVTEIKAYAFHGCISIKSVTIHDNVNSIALWAFRGCLNITSLIIGDGVTSIGKSAFDTCQKLTKLTIGNSVTDIGEYAFNNCKSLTSIVIPASVTRIAQGAFSYCGLVSAIFVNSDGWWCSQDDSATSGSNITVDILSNPETAARYLTSLYNSYYWKRSA